MEEILEEGLNMGRLFRLSLLALAPLAFLLAATGQTPPAPVPVPQTEYLAPPPSGGDDTAALQKAIDSTPDRACLVLPSPALYKVSGLNVSSRLGLRIVSKGQPDTLGVGRCGCEIQLTSTQAGQPAVVYFRWAHRCSLEGVAVTVAPSAASPVALVRVDQDPADAHSTGSCSRCVFERCLFYAPNISTPCLDFSRAAARVNCDIMTVRECVFNGGSDGIRVGANSNAKGYLVQRCDFNGCQFGVHFINGSARVLDCTFEQCGTAATATAPATGGDVAFEQFVDLLELAGLNSEMCRGEFAVWVQGVSGSAELRCSRFSALTSTSALKVRMSKSGCALAVRSCMFEGGKATCLFLPGPRMASGVILRNTWSNGVPLINGAAVPAGEYPGAQQFGLFDVGEGSTGF
jgi:hypothetical protein